MKRRLGLLVSVVVLSSSNLISGVHAQWWKRLIARVLPHKKKQKSAWKGPTIVEHFLEEGEAQELLERYTPLLRESLHKAPTDSQVKRSLYRTSSTVRLPPIGDPLVTRIEERAAQLAGFPLEYAEDFQLACYGEGELYALHRDDEVSGSAKRAATVLIYLQAPEEGGSTLFTNQRLENERSLKQQPIRTEAEAIELFQAYCAANPKQQRKKHHTVVPAINDTAVVWQNWIPNDEKSDNKLSTNTSQLTVFADASTHGACPVEKGQKCVIQQWISKSVNPLRDHHVQAIYPAGAEYSYGYLDMSSTTQDQQQQQQIPDNENSNSNNHQKPKQCFYDASVHSNRTPPLCAQLQPGGAAITDGKSQAMTLVLDGPYANVGGIRLRGRGLETTVHHPVDATHDSSSSSWTVMFWARNVQPGTTLLTWLLNEPVPSELSVQYTDDQYLEISTIKNIHERISSSKKPKLTPTNDWLWFGFRRRSSNSETSSNNDGTTSVVYELKVFDQGGDVVSTASLQLEVEKQSQQQAGYSSCQADSSASTSILILMQPRTPLEDPGDDTNNNGSDETKTNATAFVARTSSDGAISNTAAFVTKTSDKDTTIQPHADISFIVIENTALAWEKISSMRLQSRRYDRNL